MATYHTQAFSEPTVRDVSDAVSAYLAANLSFVALNVTISQNQESGFSALLAYSVP